MSKNRYARQHIESKIKHHSHELSYWRNQLSTLLIEEGEEEDFRVETGWVIVDEWEKIDEDCKDNILSFYWNKAQKKHLDNMSEVIEKSLRAKGDNDE